MDQLALIIGLLLATVVAVGLGDRLRLPYPVLMLILAVALTFIPGFPDLEICLLYTSPSPRDGLLSRMPSSA